MAGTLDWATPVAHLDESRRTAFLVRVYQHLALALVAFVVFEVFLFRAGIAEGMYDFFARSGGAWLLLLGGVAIINWFAAQAAADLTDPNRQYLGLFGVALGQALIFAPFLYRILALEGSAPVVNAVFITAIGFAGLSAVGYFTRRDLSFLRPLVMWGFVAALVLIVAAVLFGANLGTWFSVAMIGLAGAAILYQTQAVVRRYPEAAYVGAAVTLFGSLMTMFWYVLRLVSRR
jgi:FtsH-binding integral membrane protein